MSGNYVIYIFKKDAMTNHLPEPTAEVVQSIDTLLERVDELSKTGAKYSVFKVGECVGDFS